MAEFQITETKRSLPATGTGVHGNIYTGTGEGEVYQQLGRMGGEIGAFGEKLYQLQGEAELTQRISEANEGFQKLQLDLIKEDDPEQYLQRYNDYWAGVKSTEVKNGYARRRWNIALPTLHKSQQASIFNDYTNKIRENHEIAVASAIAQYIEGTGTRASVEALLRSEQEALGKDDAWVDFHLGQADVRRKAKDHAKAQEALIDYANEHPEEVRKWTSAADMKNIEPDANAKDLPWIRGLADDALRRRTEEAFDNTVTQMTKEQMADVSLDAIQTYMKQMEFPELSEAEALALKERMWSAMKSRYEGGLYSTKESDVKIAWTKTRDPVTEFTLLHLVNTGKITSADQVIPYMFQSGSDKLGPNISIPAYNKIVSGIPKDGRDSKPWDKTELALRQNNMIMRMFQTEDSGEVDSSGKPIMYVPENMYGVMQSYLDYASLVREQYQDDPVKAHELVMKAMEQLKEIKARNTLGFLDSLRGAMRYAAPAYMWEDITKAFTNAAKTARTAQSESNIMQGMRIRVRSPEGRIGNIPIEQWEEAQREGYVRIE